MTGESQETQRLDGRRALPTVRREYLLRILDDHGSATIGELAAELNVSPVTIHRDLELLDGKGALQRVQGGATSISSTPAPAAFHTRWTQRLSDSTFEKAAIAITAERHIVSGSTIFVDGSTTCLALAAALEATGKPVTLVTDSPAIAYAVNQIQQSSLAVIMAPGYVDPELQIVTGDWTTEFLGGMNFHAAFISGAGIDIRAGVTTTKRSIFSTALMALACSAQKYCLADSGKFGKSAFLSIERLDQFDSIVTDSRLDVPELAKYRAAGARIECADPLSSNRESFSALTETSLWRMTFGTLDLVQES